MPPSDRPFFRASLIVTALFWTAHTALCILNPDLYARWVLKDSQTAADGPSLIDHGVEHLTVLVLVIGILCGLYILIAQRRRIPSRLAMLWVAGWTAASVYFAGEECSWGQWYFGFGTPETWQNVNDQGETNLHNMTSWLDQKPRAMVEAFIVIGGFVAPVLLTRFRPRRGLMTHPLIGWALAPAICWPAAAAFAILWLLGRFGPGPVREVANSEVCELAIAMFISGYLASFAIRLARTQTAVFPAIPGNAPRSRWEAQA